MYSNRIDVFKDITKDQDVYNETKVDSVFNDNYPNFCTLSDEVIGNKSVEKVSLEIDVEKRKSKFTLNLNTKKSKILEYSY